MQGKSEFAAPIPNIIASHLRSPPANLLILKRVFSIKIESISSI
jgi:hypothetical protein